MKNIDTKEEDCHGWSSSFVSIFNGICLFGKVQHFG